MQNYNTIEERNQYYPRANVKVKDCLFRFIFQNKEDLLDLYNAVNDSRYQNAEELEVTTLEDAVYLTMKNDLSFLIGGTLNLYEHQSTYNPNMPIRGLLYITTLYRQYIEQNRMNIYKEKQQKLPYPQYIVFYNGERSAPDKKVLKLTDANEAVNLAVNECIEKGVLEDVLRNQRAEVVDMLLTTFDQELYEQSIREDALELGIKSLIETCQEFMTKKDTLIRLMEKFSLEQKVAEEYMEQYWNTIHPKTEKIDIIPTTFDQELYEESIREDGYEDGLELGVKAFVEMCCEFVPRENALIRLMEKFSLEQKKAEEYLEKYWK